jgi:hypothetical protein
MHPDDIENWFSYHAPTFRQTQKYAGLRAKAAELAMLILEYCPEGADKDQAVLRLREALMLANSSIACDPDRSSSEGEPPRALGR